MRGCVFYMQTERDPKIYEFPKSIYASEVEVVNQHVFNLEKDNTPNFINNEHEQARQQVEAAYSIVRPNREQINEMVIDRIAKRGQEVKEARDLFVANNPYRFQTHRQPIYKRLAFSVLNSFFENVTDKDLIEEESLIGAKIFNIEDFRFFNTDANNWWAHYGQLDFSVHYEILPMGILKSSSEKLKPNEFLGSGPELDNLDKATEAYHQIVTKKYNYNSKITTITQANSVTDNYYSLDSNKKVA